MKDSLLMCDSTEGDGKAEIVMDYVMSWSLRHATKEYSEKKDLYRYCRYMLYKLLQIEAPLKNITFTEVKVWKEWKHIDLCVEVKLINNNEEECYALLIENKYYTPLHEKRDAEGNWRNQLDVYREIFEKYYDAVPLKKNWKRKYALVSCFERPSKSIRKYREANKYGFKVFGFYSIIARNFENKKTKKYKDSESEIFNEFWLRRW